jgi:isopentenyldiphosphate isomerase
MSSEVLDIVDNSDNVIGRDTRFNVHHSKSWHRGIHVILINGKGELLMQLRGPEKDKCPNTYDLSLSEHVMSGETYEQAAMRGLQEELGIVGVKPEKILYFRMNYGDPSDNMVGVIYKLEYEGKLAMDRKEIASIEFLSPLKIKKMLSGEKEKFAYWAYEILRWYFGLPSKVQEI